MTAKLFCKTGQLAGQEFSIDRDASIGSGGTNTVVLALPTISREHARITLDDRGRYQLQDLDSRNGTRVDNRPVRGTTPLSDLHVITFAEQHDFIFQIARLAAHGEGSRRPAADLGAPPARPPVPAAPSHPPASTGNTVFRMPGPLVTPEALEARGVDESSSARATELRTPSPLIPPGPVSGASGRVGPVHADTMYQPPPGFVVPTAVMGPRASQGPAADTQFGLARGLPGGLPPEVALGRELPVEPPAGSPGLGRAQWHLEFEDPEGGGRVVHRLIDGDQRVGRSDQCEVRIDNRTLSRVHALLSVRDGRLTITDLDSANGTQVNGVRITGPVEARDGTVIGVGPIVATLSCRPLGS